MPKLKSKLYSGQVKPVRATFRENETRYAKSLLAQNEPLPHIARHVAERFGFKDYRHVYKWVYNHHRQWRKDIDGTARATAKVKERPPRRRKNTGLPTAEEAIQSGMNLIDDANRMPTVGQPYVLTRRTPLETIKYVLEKIGKREANESHLTTAMMQVAPHLNNGDELQEWLIKNRNHWSPLLPHDNREGLAAHFICDVWKIQKDSIPVAQSEIDPPDNGGPFIQLEFRDAQLAQIIVERYAAAHLQDGDAKRSASELAETLKEQIAKSLGL